MVIDKHGFRLNVGIILINDLKEVFLGRRVGQDAWQFPQGGIDSDETTEQALYRELYEEVGLSASDVEIIASTPVWISYHLPKNYIRQNSKPLVLGQRQKWYVLKLISDDRKISLDVSARPEFDSWCWVDYWHPLKEVIFFKRHVYEQALKEFEPIIFSEKHKEKKSK